MNINVNVILNLICAISKITSGFLKVYSRTLDYNTAITL